VKEKNIYEASKMPRRISDWPRKWRRGRQRKKLRLKGSKKIEGKRMARHKEKELKEFLIAARKKTRPSVSSAPVWCIQKKGERIWNPKAKRHWKQTSFGHDYRESVRNKRRAKRRKRD
jgi:ribosomal protein L39E